ncbi:MAG: hypothetical protein ONB48_02280 [candidate division KSB1 bacterium]|nr:hypothetical protein [candidate division KSB1 bacterium]MDZ7272496.1 hypothetical protein [candidate division KSB1 bacterium]MDZ7284480.1 hypothetical protein [candidate division KSB1 bacterium]MDZ7297124.1 hypothetical protein [candidate division KSB1 bacterium]MDZ7306572.1 hypothetical protein [candidate division KSB1 bacterium]
MDLTHTEHESVKRALRLDEPIPETLLQKAHQHFQHCQSCQQLIRDSARWRQRLSRYLQASHPSADAILEYLAEKKQAECLSEHFTPAGTARAVLAHLQECSLCRKRLAYYRRKSDAAERIVAAVLADERIEKKELPASPPCLFARHKRKSSRRLVSLVLAGCVPAFYLGSVGVRQIWQSPFHRLGSLQHEDFASFAERRAGAPANAEATSLQEIELDLIAGEFQQAQAAAQRFIAQENRNGYRLLRASFYDLFASLKLAHQSVWNPLAPRYDAAMVAAAISRSEPVVAKAAADSSLNRIQTFYLMHFYLAKGYLILQDPVRAREHLSVTAARPNDRQRRAMQLRDQLDRVILNSKNS